jgi:hypothetical protein
MTTGVCKTRVWIQPQLRHTLEDLAESQHRSIGAIIENALAISGYTTNGSPYVEVRVGPSWGDK